MQEDRPTLVAIGSKRIEKGHDRSISEEPTGYRDENGSPDAKLVLAFDSTFQMPQNAFVLKDFGCVEMQLTAATLYGLRTGGFGSFRSIGTIGPVSRLLYRRNNSVP